MPAYLYTKPELGTAAMPKQPSEKELQSETGLRDTSNKVQEGLEKREDS